MSCPIVQSIRVEEGICCFDLQETIVLDILQKRDKMPFAPVPVLTFPRSILDGLLQEARNSVQSGLRFVTRYTDQPEQESTAVFETIVGLDGDIINKVQADILQTEQCLSIGIAHFWLIDQLLLTLRQPHYLIIWLKWFLIILPTGIPLVNGIYSVAEGNFIVAETIAPLLGSGCSGLIYAQRDRLQTLLQHQLTQWGWAALRRWMKLTGQKYL